MKPPASNLTTGSIPRTLFLFALPIMAGNVLQTINGSINSIWVGNFLGEAALSATSNANAVIFLLLGAVFGITMASTILIAQSIGARRPEEAKRVVGTSISFFGVLAFVMALAGILLSEPILRGMQTPAESLPLALVYLRVMFLALPMSYGYFFVMAALRGAGDSKTPFYFLLLSVVLDIALNPLLIFGLGPLPRMGIAGSATATLLAQAVSFAALLRHLYAKRNPLVLHKGEFHLLRIDWGIVRSLVVKGLPMGAQMIVLSLSMVLMFKLVNRYGAETTAAFAASMQIWNYIQMPAMALGAAVSSMAAQNIGAGLWHRVYLVARTSVAFNFLLTGVPVVLLYIFGQFALGLFLPQGSPALPIALHLNRISLWSFPLFGTSMVLSGVVRAAGAVMAPLLILATAMLLVRLPGAYWAAANWSEDGIWWSFAASAVTAAALTTLYYKFGNWRSAKMQLRNAQAQAQATATSNETAL